MIFQHAYQASARVISTIDAVLDTLITMGLMSVGRVTTSQIWASSEREHPGLEGRLSQLSAQSSSGLAITKPSDDPAAAAAIMGVLGQQCATTQYGTNISDGLGWLTTADSSMTASENLVRQAKDLAIQAGNSGTSSVASRSAIATQLEGIRSDLLNQANTKYNGRSIFAGTSDASSAFDPTSYTYNGTATTAASGSTPAVTTPPRPGAAAHRARCGRHRHGLRRRPRRIRHRGRPPCSSRSTR